MNVMGVTIPGAPGIIIGFNDNISWGVTNGYDDSMDWYDITFYDTKKNEYYYDNKWISTDKIIEEIQIKNGYTFYDTITYTHHGPVVWDYSHYQKDLINKGYEKTIVAWNKMDNIQVGYNASNTIFKQKYFYENEKMPKWCKKTIKLSKLRNAYLVVNMNPPGSTNPWHHDTYQGILKKNLNPKMI